MFLIVHQFVAQRRPERCATTPSGGSLRPLRVHGGPPEGQWRHTQPQVFNRAAGRRVTPWSR